MKPTDTIRPEPTSGLRHVALSVYKFEACVEFYTHLLYMKIEWQPDADNIYLTTGHDNLALHRTDKKLPKQPSRLDHIGFIIKNKEQVDIWYDFLRNNKVILKTTPKDHRDGARSFYCEDPDGNSIQMIFHPPLAKSE
jgi:catechol 2,3-dioxygenase-like lactoylglutathione lyase family enzyme